MEKGRLSALMRPAPAFLEILRRSAVAMVAMEALPDLGVVA